MLLAILRLSGDGVRVAPGVAFGLIEAPLMQNIRCLDKLAKGKAMEKILRWC